MYYIRAAEEYRRIGEGVGNHSDSVELTRKHYKSFEQLAEIH